MRYARPTPSPHPTDARSDRRPLQVPDRNPSQSVVTTTSVNGPADPPELSGRTASAGQSAAIAAAMIAARRPAIRRAIPASGRITRALVRIVAMLAAVCGSPPTISWMPPSRIGTPGGKWVSAAPDRVVKPLPDQRLIPLVRYVASSGDVT